MTHRKSVETVRKMLTMLSYIRLDNVSPCEPFKGVPISPFSSIISNSFDVSFKLGNQWHFDVTSAAITHKRRA